MAGAGRPVFIRDKGGIIPQCGMENQIRVCTAFGEYQLVAIAEFLNIERVGIRFASRFGCVPQFYLR